MSSAISPRKAAILVVADEVLVRAMLLDALRARGYVVLEAANNVRSL
jgi:CheY-like chemotaxis protein